jgi:hypothetical protein
MMRIHKFLRLPWEDRLLLIESAFLLAAIRVGLRLLPFKKLLGFLARATPSRPSLRDSDKVFSDKVAWALGVARHYLPGVYTCLVQALAAKVIFGRRGHPARLRIGVERNEAEEFRAHAWVEHEGRVVVGGEEELTRYALFPAVEWGEALGD